MLSDDQQRLVELFVDNMIWGSVDFNSIKWKKTATKKEYDQLTSDLTEWVVYHHNMKGTKDKKSKKKMEKELEGIRWRLYMFFFAGRLGHYISGELKDRTGEIELEVLRVENKELKDNVKNLELKNKELHAHNVQLANELEDRQNLIDSYENASVKKQ